MVFGKLLVASLGLAGLVPAFTAVGSNYPPDYVISSKCKNLGDVKVCTQNRENGSFPRLAITYNGALISSQWGRISVLVTLNGKTELFKMNNSNFSETVLLGGPKNLTRCLSRIPAQPSTPYPLCRPGHGSSDFDYDLPTPEEQNLFFYARTDRGLANAWDVNVAFVGEDGTWDSLNGANYNFRFE